MREPGKTRERERRAREKFYDREGLSHDFDRPEHLQRNAEMDSPDYNSIEYQARYDIWREQAMLPGMIEPADMHAPGFGPEVVQREPMDDAPEWDLSGGNMTSSERPEWTLESETDEEFNQSHASGTDVKVDAEGNVEDIEDLDVFLDWQIANAEEVQRIRDLVKLIFRLRHENAGFISQDTEEGMHLLALGGEARLEAYRAAYGEYQKKALRGGFLTGFREALADTGDVAAAFLIAAPLGPHGLAAAAAYLQFEERQSFQQLNEPVLAEQRALFLQLLFQAEGNPVRTAALIDAFESGDSAGRHAGFIAFVLAEMAAGGGAASVLRSGLQSSRGLRRIIRHMSPAARKRLRARREWNLSLRQRKPGRTTESMGGEFADDALNWPTREVAEVAEDILASTRRGSGLKLDAEHRAASFPSREQLMMGKVVEIKGGDGVQRTLLQARGEVNGRQGIFEYIVDVDGTVTHQRFIPGGKITGRPNQRPPKQK
jgi:hypothetical protein